MTKYTHVIGIDTGCNTGISIWNTRARQFERVSTVAIHEAMSIVLHLFQPDTPEALFVRVEDARLAVHGRGGLADRFKLQGAGSVKRDAKIWEDFLTDLGVPHEMVRPKKSITKMDAATFTKITGWKERTSSHSRDASMLCFGF